MVNSRNPEHVDESKVIRVVKNNNGIRRKDQIRYNKDGSIKRTHTNRVAGQSSEVYAFKTEEEIKAMLAAFDRKIKDANTETQEQIARRNKMMFLIGINVGLRAGDICKAKWEMFFNEDMNFKNSYVLQPEKQRNSNKFITLFFNNSVKSAIAEYIMLYPIAEDELEDYVFKSRKGDGHIEPASLWRIIKEMAKEAGIEQNIGSHSLRKTWGYWCWHSAEDKTKALVILQKCFNHSSTEVTLKYIGVLNEEVSDMYNSIELGFYQLNNQLYE